MEDKKIRVAITHGDTNGIGYEVILKAFEDPTMLEFCTPIIYGSSKVASYHRKAMELETQYNVISKAEDAHPNRVNLLSTFDEEVKVEFGQPTEESAEAARKAMARAKEDLQKGLFDVLVTAPVQANPNPPREDRALTVVVSNLMRVGLVTTHLSHKEVATTITVEKLIDKGALFHTSLRRDFRISNPRIAVLALNAQLGSEEEQIVKPAVEALEQKGIQAFGPYVAETFFSEGLYDSFDGVLALSDEQGALPFKMLAHEYAIKLKTGISVVLVTSDQDPSFTIAGKGEADPISMRHAIFAAIDMYRHRAEYDAPLGNPLPKLYHEKREDGDKARFAIKAKDQFKTPPEK
jgi:4-hydroxythreonine-4-phosphate dehydrogenase